MITRIEYGVYYFSNRTFIPCPEVVAYQKVKGCREHGIPAQVLCRRVTYGALTPPRVKLLNGG